MVNNLLLQPQEIEVFYVIPALRRQLAMVMKEGGLKQSKIADLLYIKRAAVSQYISNKRGGKVVFNEDIMKEIKTSADRIVDKFTLLSEIQRLLRVVKNSGELCKIHKQFSNVPEDCEPVMINCFGGEKEGNASICYR